MQVPGHVAPSAVGALSGCRVWNYGGPVPVDDDGSQLTAGEFADIDRDVYLAAMAAGVIHAANACVFVLLGKDVLLLHARA